MSTKRFDLGDVLSITTGKLVSRDHIGGVYNICNYMLGTSHMTHQLPRAADQCKTLLMEQHPQLANVQVPKKFIDEAHVWRWLDEQIDLFGAVLEVAPAANPITRDPIDELVEMRS